MNILIVILIVAVICDLLVNIYINIMSGHNTQLMSNLTSQVVQEREQNNKVFAEYKNYIKHLELENLRLNDLIAKYEQEQPKRKTIPKKHRARKVEE